MITLRLDKNGGINKGDIKAFEHDNLSEVYIIQLYKNGAIYDLTNKSIELTMVERKRKIGDMVSLPIYEATEGKVKLEVVSDITKQDGIYDFKLTVKDTAGLIETFPSFQVEIKNDITDSITGEIIQDPNFTILTDGLKALADYNIYKTNALKVPEIEQDIVEINEQLDTIIRYNEVEPEMFRETKNDEDYILIQRALDYCYDNKSEMKIGREYIINNSIIVKNRINPHIKIRGAGGSLKLNIDKPMFISGKDSVGGLRLVTLNINGNNKNAPIFDCGGGSELIQIIVDGCDIYNTKHLLYSRGYLQSCRLINCNVKESIDYLIKAEMVFDLTITNNLIEWGSGGLIELIQPLSSNYCCHSLTIDKNVIEGITSQIPINLTHCGSCRIINNYFEGNTNTDIDLTDGLIPHKSLTINNNFFGVKENNASVKVGNIYHHIRYDFSNNMAINGTMFEFLGDCRNVNFDNTSNLSGEISNYEVKDKLLNCNITNEIIRDLNKTYILIEATLENALNRIFDVEIWLNDTRNQIYNRVITGSIFIKCYHNGEKNIAEVIFNPNLQYCGSDTNKIIWSDFIGFSFLNSDAKVIDINSLTDDVSLMCYEKTEYKILKSYVRTRY